MATREDHFSRWQLPVVVHPPKVRRYVICVPDDRFYRAAFEGLLIELTYSKNWQRDDLKTAAAVSRVWQAALANMDCDDCDSTPQIEESEYEMSLCEQIRWEDGVLQALCCGEWTDVPGFGPAVGGTVTQPSPGGTLNPGECRTYTVVLDSKNKWLAPVLVGANYKVTISAISGAASDGTIAWFCADGTPFGLGICAGSPTNEMSDPSPDQYHMALIAEHDSVFYGAYNTTFTTPGTAGDGNLELFLNDDPLADNYGSITFQVEICNQAVETVTHIFDFTTGMHGWTITDDGGATAAYVPGSGFRSTNTDGTPPHGAMTVRTPDVGQYVFLDGSLVYTATDAVAVPTGRNIAFLKAGVTLAQGNLLNGGGTQTTPLAFNGLIDEMLVTLDSDVAGDIATLTTLTVVIQGSTDPYAGL